MARPVLGPHEAPVADWVTLRQPLHDPGIAEFKRARAKGRGWWAPRREERRDVKRKEGAAASSSVPAIAMPRKIAGGTVQSEAKPAGGSPKKSNWASTARRYVMAGD